MQVAFIIGSPRSGTTILGNLLNQHPALAEWYEPYYLWESCFDASDSNIWNPMQLTARVRHKIIREFEIFAEKSDVSIVIDKSPGHVFNIPVIQRIFPDAKWIHIIRDGRDVTLSISREWAKRKQLVTQKNLWSLYNTARRMFARQPFWKYRIMAIMHELQAHHSINPLSYFNKSKWKGTTGWGPRFQNWQEYMHVHTLLQFHAMQWVASVSSLRQTWSCLPQANKIEIQYEILLQDPDTTLAKVCDVIGVSMDKAMRDFTRTLRRGNHGKWRNEFSQEEIQEILPILRPLLVELGYETAEAHAD